LNFVVGVPVVVNLGPPGKKPLDKGFVNMQQCAVKRGMVSLFAVTNLGLKTVDPTETVFQHI
jgi:biotin synthase-related radical SAM superfamily protein